MTAEKNPDIIKKICQLKDENYTVSEITERVDASLSSIKNITSSYDGKRIPDDETYGRILTRNDIKKILEDMEKGYRNVHIARMHKVWYRTIANIKSGRMHNDIVQMLQKKLSHVKRIPYKLVIEDINKITEICKDIDRYHYYNGIMQLHNVSAHTVYAIKASYDGITIPEPNLYSRKLNTDEIVSIETDLMTMSLPDVAKKYKVWYRRLKDGSYKR